MINGTECPASNTRPVANHKNTIHRLNRNTKIRVNSLKMYAKFANDIMKSITKIGEWLLQFKP
jgi:hypothetical protein